MLARRRFVSVLMIAACLLAAGALNPAAAADVPSAFVPAGKSFLAKHCVRCHGQNMPKAELALHALSDDASVLKFRKRMETVLEMVETGEMPPAKEPRPTADETAAFLRTVRGIYERADASGAVDPGRVTMRRLNRSEYNNTVRDLLKVDFLPAEDFPPDDVGHGFDNIGDVLSMSPLLMERYLAAAETISQRVIQVDTPPPSKRYLSSRYLQPNNAKTSQGRFRELAATSDDPTVSGPFTAAADYLKLTADDDLMFRATLYAESTSDKPVKVALFLAGPELPEASSDAEVDMLLGAGLAKQKPLKILGYYEITARDAKKLQTIEARVPPHGKASRAGIALVKPADGQEPAKLQVENLWSEGPLDPRPLAHRTLMAVDPALPPAARTRAVLRRLLPRAYRRPVTDAEIESLARFADQATADKLKWEAGMQRVVQAMLCSPKFLFRVELDDRPQADGAREIDEYQLASRLSYFLWSSMPDDELFELAAQKKLTPRLAQQVRRMLQDPKAEVLIDNFAMQWLQLGKLQTLSPDAQLFPAFNEKLRQAMIQETKLFLREIVREDQSVLAMVQADYTYMNEQLSKHYGMTAQFRKGVAEDTKRTGRPVRYDGWARVSLAGTDRGGLLTQASILTVTSNPTRTSPVKRGRWVLEQILGTPPPPPPPNVPELEAQKEKLTGSLRQRMEQHRQNPACASCHARMDPIGFAFEHFDAIGAARKKDGEFEIDSSGTLPDGRNIQGPGDLREVLLEKKELFARSLTEKMLTYALGRGLEFYDKRPVDRIVAGLSQDDYKFSRLIAEIVESDPFRMRRGKETSP